MTIKEVKKLKELLRGRQWEEAINSLYKQIQSIYDTIVDDYELDREVILYFEEIVKMIEQAVICKDVVLLCDMLEYEMLPFVNHHITTKG